MAVTPEITVSRKPAETGRRKSLPARLLALLTSRSATADRTSAADLASVRGREAGSVLAELLGAADPGWHVLRDVPSGHGEIDHVLLGPGGGFVVAIEEGCGLEDKQILRVDEYMLDRVDADRERLERSTGIAFEALLVVTDCWLVGSRLDHPAEVVVLPARLLPAHLRKLRPKLEAGAVAEAMRRVALV